MGTIGKRLLLAAAWMAALWIAADMLRPWWALVAPSVTRHYVPPDFMQFYLGGKLAAQGRSSELYHGPTYDRMAGELRAQGYRVYAYRFNRPPFTAYLWAPLAWLSYLTAARLAALANLILLGVIVWKLPLWFDAPGHTRILLVPFLPFLWSMGMGQDTLLLVVLLAQCLRLAERGDEAQAGLLLALCAYKPHLIWLAPLALLAGGRRKAFYVSVAAGSALVVLSFAMVGTAGVREWIHLLQGPTTDFAPAGMGNLRALALHLGTAAGAIATALAVIAFGIILRAGSFRDKFSAALIVALLLSPHTYLHDYSLLALVAMLTSYPVARYLLLLPWPFFYLREDMLPWIPLLLGYLVFQAFDLLRRPARSPGPETPVGGPLVHNSPVVAPELGMEGHSSRRLT